MHRRSPIVRAERPGLKRAVARFVREHLRRVRRVADLVVFLASERAGFLTGASITVDGGASRGVYL